MYPDPKERLTELNLIDDMFHYFCTLHWPGRAFVSLPRASFTARLVAAAAAAAGSIMIRGMNIAAEAPARVTE